jgi:F420-dependent oxidoreductase-like protein
MPTGSLVDSSGFPFRFGIATGQTEDWEALIERWRRIEAFGFDSAWVFDHFLAAGGTSVDDTYLEAWTLLAGLAARTPRVQLGVLVSGNTYRNPALVAKQAVTIDQISGGRLVLGLGAGWHEREHAAYGFHFPPPGERVSRFEEAVQIITSLMREERTTFAGKYYQVNDAAFLPRPVRPEGIPLLVGTRSPRMLRIAARYADTVNMVGGPDDVRAAGPALLEACAAVGRDPATLRLSVAAWPGRVGFDPLASPGAFVDLVGRYRELGVSEVICMWTREVDAAGLERIADETTALRGAR